MSTGGAARSSSVDVVALLKLVDAWGVRSSTADVVALLEAGADVHACSDYALRAAARRGHVDLLEVLLRAGADPRTREFEALRVACQFGHVGVVSVLLRLLPCVVGLNEAALGGHMAVARLLLSKAPRLSRGKAVVKAAGAGHREMVAFLLQGCDTYDSLDKALYKASANGHASVVRLLLFAGAKPKEALRESLKFGHVDVALMLVPFSSREARTAVLDAAVMWGHEDVVRALLAEGVNGLHNETFVSALIVEQLTTARLLLEGPTRAAKGPTRAAGGVVWLRAIDRGVLYAAAPRALWSAFERLGAMPPRGHERHRSYVLRVWWTLMRSLLEVRELQRAWRHKYYGPSGAGGRAALVRLFVCSV